MKVLFEDAVETVAYSKCPKSGLKEIKNVEAAIEIEEKKKKKPFIDPPSGIIYSDENQLWNLVEKSWDMSWPTALTEQALNAMGYSVCDLAFLEPVDRRRAIDEMRARYSDIKVDIKRLKARLKDKKLLTECEFLQKFMPLASDSGKYALRPDNRAVVFRLVLHRKSGPLMEDEIFFFQKRGDEERERFADVFCEQDIFTACLHPNDASKTQIIVGRNSKDAAAQIEETLKGAEKSESAVLKVEISATITVAFTPAVLLRPECAVPPVNIFDPGNPLSDETFQRLPSEPLPFDKPMICARLGIKKGRTAPNKSLSQWQAVAAWQKTQGPLYDPDFEPSTGRILLACEELNTIQSHRIDADDGTTDGFETYKAFCSYPDIYRG
ncbi:MAG: hypothetical protein HY747_06550 [Elusimicrobia bacterium]|nr:hypothetical protein [Elusimicrobiota bacterium]